MISMSYLFENTKIRTGEKIAAGLGIASGLGIGGLAHKIKHDADIDVLHHKPDLTWDNTPDGEITKYISGASADIRNLGLGTAAAIGGALAAHKLYKNYKNKQ